MTRLLLLLGLAALAACSSAPPGSRLAECQSEALQDPTVQAAILRANSPLQEVRIPGVMDQKRAYDRAVQGCMAGPGQQYGVEPVAPQY